MRDGVLDVDVTTSATRGFFGFDFRIDPDGANYDEVYLRPHKSGLPDALQYTPVLKTGRNWQISAVRVSPTPSTSRRTSGSIYASR